MAASPSSVLSLGLGVWSDPYLLVTLGFGSSIVTIPDNHGPTSASGFGSISAVSGKHAATAVSGRHAPTHMEVS